MLVCRSYKSSANKLEGGHCQVYSLLCFVDGAPAVAVVRGGFIR